MTAQRKERTSVFISYSHKDDEWLQRLRVHLKPLTREHRIEIWDDTRIAPGSKWRDEIQRALATAKVAVLLVSADFLASDFIASDELPPLLSAAEKEGAIILPVVLSPSRFMRTRSLSQFQSVNEPSKPLIGMAKSDQESVLVRVTEAIEAAFEPPPAGARRYGDESDRDDEFASANNAGVASVSRNTVGVSGSTHRLRASRWRPLIWIGIVVAVLGVVAAYWLLAASRRPVQVEGRVTDSNTQRPVAGAVVTVAAKDVPHALYTDPGGVFKFEWRERDETFGLRIQAAGYEPYYEEVRADANITRYIRLVPLNTVPQDPLVSPSPSVSTNKNGKSPTPNRTGGDRASDLERRKQRARDDLNSSAP